MTTHQQDLEDELVSLNTPILVIAGAGVSIATDSGNPCAGWGGLLRHGLTWCRDRCHRVRPDVLATYEHLLSQGEFLPVATFIARTLQSAHEGEFARWLSASIGELRLGDDSVIRGLAALGVQIATTNYDNLIEQYTGRTPSTWKDASLAFEFLRGRGNTILHLHGHYQRPETVVFSAASYEDICRDQSSQAILQAFLMTRTIIFVGCGAGLGDPSFGALLTWSRGALAKSAFTHYRLALNTEMTAVSQECVGLPVKPIEYGSQHSDLGRFLLDLQRRVAERRRTLTPLDVLSNEQSTYGVQRELIEQSRESLSSNEYVMRKLESARQLWSAGGHLTAALEMSTVFERESDKLASNERLRIGLEIANMLLETRLERPAASVLQRITADVERSEVNADFRDQFSAAHIKCMNNLCAYDETIAAIHRALEFASPLERERLIAQRSEIHFLQGDFDEALLGWSGEGSR